MSMGDAYFTDFEYLFGLRSHSFTGHKLGKGKVYFLAFPLEQSLAGHPMCYCADNAVLYWRIYREIAWDVIEQKICISENPQVAVTLHPESDSSMLAVAVNYSNVPQDARLRIADGWKYEYIYGSETIEKCDMAVRRLTK